MKLKKIKLPNLLNASPFGNDFAKASREKVQDQQSSEKWKRDRLRRITGSKYDNINFVDVRHEKGSKATKKDMIEWIGSRGYAYKLENQVHKCGKNDVSQLSKAEIGDVYFSIEPTREMSAGTETYLDWLIGCNIVKSPRGEDITARALEHGNKYEPDMIEEFKKWLQKEYPDLEFEFVRGGFNVNPHNPLHGSSCDLEVYLKGEDKPMFVLEGKCPYNTKNHARKLRKGEFDKRYRKQNIGYFYNIPSVQKVFFVSYEPDAEREEHKLHVLVLDRSKVEPEIDQFVKDLNLFTEIYLEELKKIGINYPNLLS